MELLDVLELHLNPWRELPELRVVGDLEGEEPGRGEEVALHGHRTPSSAELEELQAAHGREAGTDLAEEVGVGGVREERGALLALPAPRLELQEALHGFLVARTVHDLERGAERLLEPPALTLQLVAAAGGQPLERAAAVSVERRSLELDVPGAKQAAAFEGLSEGRGHRPLGGDPLQRQQPA